MDVEFEDSDLERLAYDASYVGKWSPAIVKKFRKVVVLFKSFKDRRSIYVRGGFQLEKMEGEKDISTIRLNKQWRLFFRFKKKNEGEAIVVIRIGDPH